jgi:hypothetical protein
MTTIRLNQMKVVAGLKEEILAEVGVEEAAEYLVSFH